MTPNAITLTICPNCKRHHHPGADLRLLTCACGWWAKYTGWGWIWYVRKEREE